MDHIDFQQLKAGEVNLGVRVSRNIFQVFR
jgi:hypothetical protein